jgi:hypothetical protein
VRLPEVYAQMKAEAGKVIVGQDEVFEQVVVAFLAGGHVLLEGVPGVAKTLIAKTLARLIDAGFGRIQFTADLMPSDVVGTQVFDINAGQVLPEARGRSSPHRAGRRDQPRAGQDAIRAAGGDGRAPGDHRGHALPARRSRSWCWRHRIRSSTKAPTRCPKRSLDRFLFKVVVDYPPEAVEREIVRRYHTGFDAHHLDRSRPAAGGGRRGPARTAHRGNPQRHRRRRHPRLHHADRRGDAAQPGPDAGGQPARQHRLAAHGQDLRRAARPRLRHARRCEADAPCPSTATASSCAQRRRSKG